METNFKDLRETNEMYKKEEEDFKEQLRKDAKLIEAEEQATLWIQAHWRGYRIRTEKR